MEKVNPIFKRMRQSLKDPKNFLLIETQLADIMKSDHTHKTVKEFITCAWCNKKRQQKEKAMKDLGFKDYRQYLEWRKVHGLIIEVNKLKELKKKQMKVVNKYPPNHEEITKVFDLTGLKPVFAYGKILYNPHQQKITPDLMVHEMTHSEQQKGDPVSWWNMYLTDKEFRLQQEIEAYGAQYFTIKQATPEEVSRKYLEKFATDLSSKLYGDIISLPEALSKIRNHAKNVQTN